MTRFWETLVVPNRIVSLITCTSTKSNEYKTFSRSHPLTHEIPVTFLVVYKINPLRIRTPKEFFSDMDKECIVGERVELLYRMLRVPTIGKTVVKFLRKRGFKSIQTPLEKAIKEQNIRLKKKFGRMEGTEIGKKLGVRGGTKLQDIPLTEYSFYSGFFNNPTPSAFMYPLEDYMRARTSGTSGVAKWFMIPKKGLSQAFRETGILILLSLFHDGEKITFEYGDTLYLNLAPRPFIGGLLASTEVPLGIINIVPNLNLSYQDKIQFFIDNSEHIDASAMLASTLVSQILPFMKKPIKLKGLLVFDSSVAEVYMEKIKKSVGISPKYCYGSTETNHPSISSIQHPLSFIFDWRRGCFEFLPVKEGKVIGDELIGLGDVKPGEVYELIYTSFEGELTRYNTGDCLMCVARGDDIIGTEFPVFKFHARLEKAISLQNFTRISEGELLTVLEETDIPFADFTTRVEIDRGMEHLVMYIEHAGDVTAKEIEERVHNKLMEIDGDYRELVNFFKYEPVNVELVPAGVFAEYLREKISGVPKVERINMRDEEFKRFLEVLEKHQE